MLPDYSDIRSAIDRDPEWFDGQGVPRYAPFSPDMLGIYDKFAVLAEIMCQSCSCRLLVADGWASSGWAWKDGAFTPTVYTLEFLLKNYRYGDPPRHHCSGAGESMSSISVRLVEVWQRDPGKDWKRQPEAEKLSVVQDWAEDWF